MVTIKGRLGHALLMYGTDVHNTSMSERELSRVQNNTITNMFTGVTCVRCMEDAMPS